MCDLLCALRAVRRKRRTACFTLDGIKNSVRPVFQRTQRFLPLNKFFFISPVIPFEIHRKLRFVFSFGLEMVQPVPCFPTKSKRDDDFLG